MKHATPDTAQMAAILKALASLNDGCGVVEIHVQHGKLVRIKRQDVFLPEEATR